jgi:hypothetical protein
LIFAGGAAGAGGTGPAAGEAATVPVVALTGTGTGTVTSFEIETCEENARSAISTLDETQTVNRWEPRTKELKGSSTLRPFWNHSEMDQANFAHFLMTHIPINLIGSLRWNVSPEHCPMVRLRSTNE